LEEIMAKIPIQKNLPVLMLYNIGSDWSRADIDESTQIAQTLSSALRGEGHPVTEVRLEDHDLAGLLQPYHPDEFIVFNTCEEIPGFPHSYDLAAQILEELGFTFTGTGSKALSFSQDKRKVKQRLDACGIKTPRWQIFNTASQDGWSTFPAIVKPALEHCSLGLTRESVVWSAADLASRIGLVIERYQGPALVEEFIDGREFAVNVVGNSQLRVLPIAEFDFSAFEAPQDHLLSYDSKFSPLSKAYNLIKTNLPAILTKEEEKRISKTAVDGYRAAGCRDYARLDMRMRDGNIFILDINPNADIRPDVSSGMAAELAGLPYGAFGSLLVNLAAERHPIYGEVVREGVLLD
jgi:D-alanine-D-alanine ligase